MTLDDSQNWTTHFYGKGGVFSALNQRLFILRRMKNHLLPYGLRKVAESLFNSKLRYGLQNCSEVRISETETRNTNLKAVQIAQNKLLRLLDNSPISERTSTSVLLRNTGMLSVNWLLISN